jgi:chromate transporter
LKDNKTPSLAYLFFTFLKIGATSFGGFMLQISMTQKQLVDKDKVIDNESILDGISLASILPGPMAANLVAYIGYKLKGIRGAMAAIAGVIFPAFILMVILSYFYFKYGNSPAVDKALRGIMPAVCAIILSVAINLARKNIKNIWQWIIAISGLSLLVFFGGFLTTLGIIVFSAAAGIIIDKNNSRKTVTEYIPGIKKNKTTSKKQLFYYSILIVVIFLIIYSLPYQNFFSVPEILKKIHAIFFQIGFASVTLFGGGYVFIPTLRELFVDQLHWVTQKEFIEGIALGQVTPGPIMISAAFIGYKLAGFWGALTGTLAIFGPPATLMILFTKFLMHFKNSPFVTAAFRGIHPAVIGMIFAAVFSIGKSIEIHWLELSVFSIALFLVFWYKIDVALIILGAAMAGYLLT